MNDPDAFRIARLKRQVELLTEQNETVRRELEALSYAVSHDLRAPLRSVSGFSQALAELTAGTLTPQAQHYLNRIQEAAHKMSEQIDALLALSRLTRADMQQRSLDLAQLCREAVDKVAAKYPDHRPTIDMPNSLPAFGSPRLLRTALEHLLDNAFKFTARRSNPSVRIGQGAPAGAAAESIPVANPTHPETTTRSETTTYYVQDNGVGFDMAYADKLFQPFQKLHAEKDFIAQGIGIGLAAAFRIVARHGGRMWAQSQPDRGTIIYFSLPNAPAAADS